MMQQPPDPAMIGALRQVIGDFLQERLQLKLDKLKDDEVDQRQALLQGYRTESWIADAAKRVGQIQQVTHALKFTHPDAKGSNLNAPGNAEAGELSIGTHTLGSDLTPDVVGNAAALDVNKFLRLTVAGQSLLARAMAGDAALQAALSDDAEQAAGWMAAFAGLAAGKGQPASHKLAKQIYWPLADGGYHLLAPLFPTSLVHGVHQAIREDRFSEEAKAAREARRAGANHPHGYREYPFLAIQNFGGTKPQNISQLNSERYGENYLLPSLPPNWQSEPVRPPLHSESVFEQAFGARQRVKELTRGLRDFLARVAAVNNIHIRATRAAFVADIRDELLQFAAELQQLPPGWSAQTDCALNRDEQCWLDPARAEGDPDFAHDLRRGDWQDAVCRRFGNWLNARLNRPQVTLGQAEAEAWSDVLEQALRSMRPELASHE
jgi:CRISPR-associated protein Csy1